jgi:hypothetical protein
MPLKGKGSRSGALGRPLGSAASRPVDPRSPGAARHDSGRKAFAGSLDRTEGRRLRVARWSRDDVAHADDEGELLYLDWPELTLETLVAGTDVTDHADPGESRFASARFRSRQRPYLPLHLSVMNEKAEYHRLNDPIVRQFPAYFAIVLPVDTVLGEIER